MKTHCASGHDLKIGGVTKSGYCLSCNRERHIVLYHSRPEVAARDKLRDKIGDMYAAAYIWQPDK
jgi:hypothetical protein